MAASTLSKNKFRKWSLFRKKVSFTSILLWILLNVSDQFFCRALPGDSFLHVNEKPTFYLVYFIFPEAYLELCQTTKMERFAKKVQGFYPLVIFTKHSILDNWQGSEYVSGVGYFSSNAEVVYICRWSLSIHPRKLRKPKVFWFFQRVKNGKAINCFHKKALS